jgi:pyruvate dehydrogenase E1 component
MSKKTFVNDADLDPQETKEWTDALDSVITQEGADRAHFLIEKVIGQAREAGVDIPYSANTEYINTIPADQQPKYPGNPDMEIKIHSYIRWNAMAMVVRANKDTNVGGHIASFASAAALYDVGYSHFWRSINDPSGGDLIFFQGHSVPGVYSRAFMLGRLTQEQMDNFRQETGGKGISSYPHPWLMPDFWQFPTVSMGLGPIQAIYQARFMKYLDSRGLAKAGDRKVWAFLGDGETDEVESLGAIGMAGREKLDNLIFVINCNLQRLDGPVRGNGKIIQELESEFRGAGWNVIKLVWGTHWDTLFNRDKKGILKKRMMELVDGQYQTFKAKNGAYVREHFFNTPELRELVADWTDDEVWALNRGGHDIFKIFAAYDRAIKTKGAADTDPGQDHQGLWHGPGWRSDEHLAPAEEDGQGADRPLPRPLQPAGAGRQARRTALPEVRRRFGRAQVHDAAPHGPRRFPAAAPPQGRTTGRSALEPLPRC